VLFYRIYVEWRAIRSVEQAMSRFVDKLSFNDRIRDLAIILNQKVEHSGELAPFHNSHPGGFVRELHKRRIGIAESYILISKQLGTSSYEKRLDALRTMVELSLHAKTVSMPLNTARVQIELMKEAVKDQGNKRRQMERIADFSIASFGQEAVIRRFLRQRRMIEVPETRLQLKELDLGWDSHVHDNLSEGRKTPSQVVVDAFIKGLSRLTLAYYDISNRDIVTEAMKAGEILGIDVTVGVEFSTGHRTRRRHFMYIPPAYTPDEFYEFFDDNKKYLARFIEGLEENRRRRHQTVTQILDHFNRIDLNKINEGYENDRLYALPPLRIEELEAIVMEGQYTRIHLGELVYTRLKEVLKKRVLALKLQYEVSRQLIRRGKLTGWELEGTRHKYLAAREYYQQLTPDEVMAAYLEGKNIIDYDSAFPSEADILPDLKAAGGSIVYIHPLADGINAAVSTIICNHRTIDRVELINMYDSVKRNPGDILVLTNFVRFVNNDGYEELGRFLKDRDLACPDPAALKKAVEHYSQAPLVPLAGSDSTGREPHIPGMGFIRQSRIPSPSRKQFIKHHYRLPPPVAQMITSGGTEVPKTEKEAPEHQIYSMGKAGQFTPNLVGDEESLDRIGPLRFWRYLNPAIKKILRVCIAMVPATLQIGPAYMAVWLGITFMRNVLVDLISASGLKPSDWHTKDVNFDFTTQSVFWTGFSVPVLALVKHGFDVAWPLEHEGPLFEWCKFFFICFANGTYISTHNRLRGFSRGVIRANFFRSVLAWPFAAVFAPAGNFLMIPSIVQAKLWSDVVAGVIEGTGKFRQRMVLRKRDLGEILPRLGSADREERLLAMLDVLFIWARQHRGRTSLAHLLRGKGTLVDALLGLFRRKRASAAAPTKEKLHERIVLMVELYNPQRAMSELSRFILGSYGDREAVVLIELVSAHVTDFYAWLKKMERKLAPS
jgi:hypothetical protein